MNRFIDKYINNKIWLIVIEVQYFDKNGGVKKEQGETAS